MVKGMSSTSPILGRPFAGKTCSWHGLWEQHCRQLLGGPVGCATLQPRGPGAFFCPQVIQCIYQKPRHRGSRDRAELKERVGVGAQLVCFCYCPSGKNHFYIISICREIKAVA